MPGGNERRTYLPGFKDISLKELLYYVDFIGRQTLEVPRYLAPEDFSIKINGVPEGSLIPDEVRRDWVGITLAEARVLSEDIETNHGEKLEKGRYYGVPITSALPALLQHSPSAARWFGTRSPMPAWLFFEIGVAEVVNK